MSIEEYKEENAALRQRVAELEKANSELIIHNMLRTEGGCLL